MSADLYLLDTNALIHLRDSLHQLKPKDSERQRRIEAMRQRCLRDEVKGRSVADIAYWMLDDDYDGASFTPRQVFFCGGERDEFDKFRRGLSSLALASTKKAAERTLKVELDDEAFERVYGHVSHPVPWQRGRRLAVRVVSQFGEESTKVLTL